MLILSRYLNLAVILTTYLCSLSHLVESRHMFDSLDQILEPRLDTRLSLPSVNDRTIRQSSLPNNTSHHKRRHKHHLINNVNNYNNSINNNNNLIQSLKSSDNERNIPTSREFLLYSRCSHNYISVLDKLINAKALEDNEYSLMSLETIPGNSIGIRILSVKAGVYLCFNNRGKLITQHIADNIGCKFSEEITGARYIKFRSLYNPDWYMGFNRNGRPMKGKIQTPLLPHQHLKREKCYHFIKKTPQSATPTAQTLDSSHEIHNNQDRNIKPISVKAGNPNVINSRNNLRSKTNKKSVHRLMRSSAKQLINNNNFSNNENFPTNSSIDTNIRHNPNVRHRLNGRAITLTAMNNK